MRCSAPTLGLWPALAEAGGPPVLIAFTGARCASCRSRKGPDCSP